MLQIWYDETPLADEEAVKATIDLLELDQHYFEPSHAERARFPSVGADWDARPYWARFLDDRVTSYKWVSPVDVWLTVHQDDGILRGLAIAGLNGVEEAKALRADCFRVRTQSGKPLTTEVIDRTAEELFNPTGYPHQRVFVSALRNIRSYFKWENGEVIDGDGWILPLSKLNLPPDDVELLREVFRRIPPIGGAISVRDGQRAMRQSPAKSLKSARKRVEELSGDFADEGFAAWLDDCLQTKTEKWTRSTPLYEHYKEWLRKGGFGDNRDEKAHAKATALSQVKWGRLMRRRFPAPDACRQDKHSVLYRAVPKRGA